MTLQLGILLALVCAFVTNLAFFYKHRGACEAPPVDVRHPLRSAKELWSSKWFAIGMCVAICAWVFHVGALALAPMSVVKAVLAGGVVLLAVMAERLFGFKVGRRQWAGLACTAIGLALLAITLPAAHGANSGFSTAGMVAFEVGLLGIGGLLMLAPRVGAPVEHHGVMLAAAAGILFGVSDVAIKAMTGMLGDGVLGIVSPWLAICLLASVAAFYASARGLQVGEAVPVIAVTGAAANITGIAGGIIVFGDPLPGHTLGIVLQSLAFVMVIVASALMPAPVRAAGIAPAHA
jgi:drug/metabolite transporter (DMT)-like permease